MSFRNEINKNNYLFEKNPLIGCEWVALNLKKVRGRGWKVVDSGCNETKLIAGGTSRSTLIFIIDYVGRYSVKFEVNFQSKAIKKHFHCGIMNNEVECNITEINNLYTLDFEVNKNDVYNEFICLEFTCDVGTNMRELRLGNDLTNQSFEVFNIFIKRST